MSGMGKVIRRYPLHSAVGLLVAAGAGASLAGAGSFNTALKGANVGYGVPAPPVVTAAPTTTTAPITTTPPPPSLPLATHAPNFVSVLVSKTVGPSGYTFAPVPLYNSLGKQFATLDISVPRGCASPALTAAVLKGDPPSVHAHLLSALSGHTLVMSFGLALYRDGKPVSLGCAV
jgi:hypothetical protein